MPEHPLAGMVEIVGLRGDIGHVGKHGAELRQVPSGVSPLRPPTETKDSGLEEPIGEIVLGEFVIGDIESVTPPTVRATGLGGHKPAAFENVEPILDGHVATLHFTVDGVPEPMGKNPKENFREGCGLFGQLPDESGERRRLAVCLGTQGDATLAGVFLRRR